MFRMPDQDTSFAFDLYDEVDWGPAEHRWILEGTEYVPESVELFQRSYHIHHYDDALRLMTVVSVNFTIRQKFVEGNLKAFPAAERYTDKPHCVELGWVEAFFSSDVAEISKGARTEERMKSLEDLLSDWWLKSQEERDLLAGFFQTSCALGEVLESGEKKRIIKLLPSPEGTPLSAEWLFDELRKKFKNLIFVDGAMVSEMKLSRDHLAALEEERQREKAAKEVPQRFEMYINRYRANRKPFIYALDLSGSIPEILDVRFSLGLEKEELYVLPENPKDDDKARYTIFPGQKLKICQQEAKAPESMGTFADLFGKIK